MPILFGLLFLTLLLVLGWTFLFQQQYPEGLAPITIQSFLSKRYSPKYSIVVHVTYTEEYGEDTNNVTDYIGQGA